MSAFDAAKLRAQRTHAKLSANATYGGDLEQQKKQFESEPPAAAPESAKGEALRKVAEQFTQSLHERFAESDAFFDAETEYLARNAVPVIDEEKVVQLARKLARFDIEEALAQFPEPISDDSTNGQVVAYSIEVIAACKHFLDTYGAAMGKSDDEMAAYYKKLDDHIFYINVISDPRAKKLDNVPSLDALIKMRIDATSSLYSDFVDTESENPEAKYNYPSAAGNVVTLVAAQIAGDVRVGQKNAGEMLFNEDLLAKLMDPCATTSSAVPESAPVEATQSQLRQRKPTPVPATNASLGSTATPLQIGDTIRNAAEFWDMLKDLAISFAYYKWLGFDTPKSRRDAGRKLYEDLDVSREQHGGREHSTRLLNRIYGELDRARLSEPDGKSIAMHLGRAGTQDFRSTLEDRLYYLSEFIRTNSVSKSEFTAKFAQFYAGPQIETAKAAFEVITQMKQVVENMREHVMPTASESEVVDFWREHDNVFLASTVAQKLMSVATSYGTNILMRGFVNWMNQDNGAAALRQQAHDKTRDEFYDALARLKGGDAEARRNFQAKMSGFLESIAISRTALLHRFNQLGIKNMDEVTPNAITALVDPSQQDALLESIYSAKRVLDGLPKLSSMPDYGGMADVAQRFDEVDTRSLIGVIPSDEVPTILSNLAHLQADKVQVGLALESAVNIPNSTATKDTLASFDKFLTELLSTVNGFTGSCHDYLYSNRGTDSLTGGLAAAFDVHMSDACAMDEMAQLAELQNIISGGVIPLTQVGNQHFLVQAAGIECTIINKNAIGQVVETIRGVMPLTKFDAKSLSEQWFSFNAQELLSKATVGFSQSEYKFEVLHGLEQDVTSQVANIARTVESRLSALGVGALPRESFMRQISDTTPEMRETMYHASTLTAAAMMTEEVISFYQTIARATKTGMWALLERHGLFDEIAGTREAALLEKLNRLAGKPSEFRDSTLRKVSFAGVLAIKYDSAALARFELNGITHLGSEAALVAESLRTVSSLRPGRMSVATLRSYLVGNTLTGYTSFKGPGSALAGLAGEAFARYNDGYAMQAMLSTLASLFTSTSGKYIAQGIGSGTLASAAVRYGLSTPSGALIALGVPVVMSIAQVFRTEAFKLAVSGNSLEGEGLAGIDLRTRFHALVNAKASISDEREGWAWRKYRNFIDQYSLAGIALGPSSMFVHASAFAVLPPVLLNHYVSFALATQIYDCLRSLLYIAIAADTLPDAARSILPAFWNAKVAGIGALVGLGSAAVWKTVDAFKYLAKLGSYAHSRVSNVVSDADVEKATAGWLSSLRSGAAHSSAKMLYLGTFVGSKSLLLLSRFVLPSLIAEYMAKSYIHLDSAILLEHRNHLALAGMVFSAVSLGSTALSAYHEYKESKDATVAMLQSESLAAQIKSSKTSLAIVAHAVRFSEQNDRHATRISAFHSMTDYIRTSGNAAASKAFSGYNAAVLLRSLVLLVAWIALWSVLRTR
jgi:hypothetical protein